MHTPGPWRTQGWVPCWTYIPVKDAHHNVVASLYPDLAHNYSRDQVAANAALIIAAPDMLAALRLALDVAYSSYLPHPDGVTDPKFGKQVVEARDAIRAAIAKAESALCTQQGSTDG